MTKGRTADNYRARILERSPRCAGATDVGVVRESNEDAYWISPDGCVLVVADGLGGLPAGERASAAAVAGVEDFLQSAASPAGAARDAALLSKESLLGEGLLVEKAGAAIAAAQRRVLGEVDADPECRGMATTVVLAIVEERRVVVRHVGDSRAQLWRNGRLARTTYDHNAVGDLLRRGAITADEARNHPARNTIREVLGIREGYRSECAVWSVEAGDVLLLCSDGVSDVLDEETVAGLLGSEPTAASAALALVEAAGRESGQDNATVALLRVT